MPMTNLTTDNITYLSAHRQEGVASMDVHSGFSTSPVPAMSANTHEKCKRGRRESI